MCSSTVVSRYGTVTRQARWLASPFAGQRGQARSPLTCDLPQRTGPRRRPGQPYNQQRRVYAVGTISGEYRHDPSFDVDDPNVRPVKWRDQEISCDAFSTGTRNTLGSTLTLFLLSHGAEQEMQRVAERGLSPTADRDITTDLRVEVKS